MIDHRNEFWESSKSSRSSILVGNIEIDLGGQDPFSKKQRTHTISLLAIWAYQVIWTLKYLQIIDHRNNHLYINTH